MFTDRQSMRVGGITIAIDFAEGVLHKMIPEELRRFLSSGEPDFVIRLRNSSFPAATLSNENRIFDSPPLWSTHLIDGRQVLAVEPSESEGPLRVAVFDPKFTSVDIYSSPRAVSMDAGGLLLEWPFAQLLMVSLLSRRGGLMAHACGIVDGAKGYLFMGNSGHGKSTMAQLWQGKATILNDDRIIVRRDGDRFLISGTPWHGDHPEVSPLGVPLDAVFFLKQATGNTSAPVRGAEACAMIVSRSFPPLWDPAGMSLTLDFAARLAGAVPCYELGFRCDERVTDFVRCVK
jgi:hypothetical protein